MLSSVCLAANRCVKYWVDTVPLELACRKQHVLAGVHIWAVTHNKLRLIERELLLFMKVEV